MTRPCLSVSRPTSLIASLKPTPASRLTTSNASTSANSVLIRRLRFLAIRLSREKLSLFELHRSKRNSRDIGIRQQFDYATEYLGGFIKSPGVTQSESDLKNYAQLFVGWLNLFKFHQKLKMSYDDLKLFTAVMSPSCLAFKRFDTVVNCCV